ncbi:hypothetical protein T11_7155 [Trichinella zimbabwensis]|uniref:Uncharacterized protein n=1 Tax=Trichinella zimbabwensis TaxID=268475 RepID=A0A0V1H1L7_9BILA|nr:hypothetical protein T11_7155 [Trichinella zimbabwensis]
MRRIQQQRCSGISRRFSNRQRRQIPNEVFAIVGEANSPASSGRENAPASEVEIENAKQFQHVAVEFEKRTTSEQFWNFLRQAFAHIFRKDAFGLMAPTKNFSKLFSPPVNARARLSPAIFDKLLSTSFRKVEHHHHYLHF